MARIFIDEMFFYPEDGEFAAACYLGQRKVGEIVCRRPNWYDLHAFGLTIRDLPCEHGARRLAEILILNYATDRRNTITATALKLVAAMFPRSKVRLSSSKAA